MKNKILSLIIVGITITMVSCKKEATNEVKTNQKQTISSNHPIANGSSDYRNYADVVTSIENIGYSLVDSTNYPTGLSWEIDVTNYSGTTKQLFYNSTFEEYIELYRVPNWVMADNIAEDKECIYKSVETNVGTTCSEDGKDCKVKITLTDNKPAYVIICCN